MTFFVKLRKKEVKRYGKKVNIHFIEPRPVTVLEKRHKSFLFEKQEEIKRLSSFNNYIEDFLRSDSMNKISDKKPRFIPKSLILAPHYNKVYKAYLMLHDKKDILKLDKQYRYFWRSTELLYEIWTYIKTIEALRIKGFEPISGWIFNTSEYAEILPF